MTHTYFTPSTPDKPGEVIEVRVPTVSQQQFMPLPAPYFARTGNLTSAERTALEKERTALKESLPRLGFAERARAESRVSEIERELTSEIDAEREARREREQPTLRDPMKGGGRPASNVEQFVGKACVVNGKRYVRSDSGDSYLQVA